MSDSTKCYVRFNKADFLKAVEQAGKMHLLNEKGYCILPATSRYVQEGEECCKVSLGYGSVSFLRMPIKAPCSGYFIFEQRDFRNCDDRTPLATIYKDLNTAASRYEMKASVEIDDFTGEYILEWEKTSGEPGAGFDFDGLSIELTLLNNKPAIKVNCSVGKDKYKKGDVFEILLSNSEVLSFVLDDNPRGYTGSVSKCRYCEFYIKVDRNVIDNLTLHKALKVRLRQKSNSNICVVGNNDCICSEDLSQVLFQKYVETYKKTLMENGYVWETDEEQPDSIDPCYVYLMVDTANGYHKIGISNKPEYRERTLQSEKPTIEKVCAKQYPSRIIAEAIESALHKAYEAKRIRGEWFNLSDQDVNELKITLS